MLPDPANDHLMGHCPGGHAVVGEEVRRLAMGGVRLGRFVDLVQHPAGGIVLLLADIEAKAPWIARNRLARVVQQRLLELLEHLRTNGHDNDNNMHGSLSLATVARRHGIKTNDSPRLRVSVACGGEYTSPMKETIGFIGLGLMGRPM